MLYKRPMLVLAGIALSTLPVAAQNLVDAGALVLKTWSDDDLYESEAWSVDQFFGRNVIGDGGVQIGDVEDVVLNDAGEVVALIAEIGGFWDIGDTHVSVPWERVELREDGSVGIPVTEETIAEYDLFDTSGLPEDVAIADDIVEGVGSEELGPELWRASGLIGSYVRVQSDSGDRWVNFGYVDDIMVGGDKIAGTIISATGRYGPRSYAYPYRGGPDGGTAFGTWSPGSYTYDLPILVGEAVTRPEFDPRRMKAE